MLIAAIGYLYVMGILSVIYMVNGHVFIGLFMLLFVTLLPVGLWLWLISRSRRARVAAYEEKQARAARPAPLADDPLRTRP